MRSHIASLERSQSRSFKNKPGNLENEANRGRQCTILFFGNICYWKLLKSQLLFKQYIDVTKSGVCLTYLLGLE